MPYDERVTYRKREVGHALHAVAMHSITLSPIGADWLLPRPSAVSRWWSYLHVVLVRTLLRARNGSFATRAREAWANACQLSKRAKAGVRAWAATWVWLGRTPSTQ